MKSPRTAAAIITAAAAVLLVLLLTLGHLTINVDPWPPVSDNHTPLAEIEEEFVDLFDPTPVHANPSPAYAEPNVRNNSEAAEAAGSDLRDAGEPAPPAPVKTSERPSDVKARKKDTPAKTGPDRKAQEQEEARRRARKGIADAFKETKPEDPDNTQSKGKEKGDSGSPDGASSDLNGTGSGTVGGGWIMPRYAKVDSRQTGSIELRAIVDAAGKVVSVDLVGGKAPAAADPALVSRCIAEIKRHRFTRNDDAAPAQSTARITYIFR